MVTAYREDGFRVIIFSNDHSPAHVHVFNNGGHAKINLLPKGRTELVRIQGMKKSEVRKALKMVEKQHAMLLA